MDVAFNPFERLDDTHINNAVPGLLIYTGLLGSIRGGGFVVGTVAMRHQDLSPFKHYLPDGTLVAVAYQDEDGHFDFLRTAFGVNNVLTLHSRLFAPQNLRRYDGSTDLRLERVGRLGRVMILFPSCDIDDERLFKDRSSPPAPGYGPRVPSFLQIPLPVDGFPFIPCELSSHVQNCHFLPSSQISSVIHDSEDIAELFSAAGASDTLASRNPSPPETAQLASSPSARGHDMQVHYDGNGIVATPTKPSSSARDEKICSPQSGAYTESPLRIGTKDDRSGLSTQARPPESPPPPYKCKGVSSERRLGSDSKCQKKDRKLTVAELEALGHDTMAGRNRFRVENGLKPRGRPRKAKSEDHVNPREPPSTPFQAPPPFSAVPNGSEYVRQAITYPPLVFMAKHNHHTGITGPLGYAQRGPTSAYGDQDGCDDAEGRPPLDNS